MKHKYFPITTQPACQSKWTWSTIRLYTGTTSSCHRVIPENITPDTFDSFHNTPFKLKDRKTMLAGEWPGRGCEYCRDLEITGKHSDRTNHLQIPYLTPHELDTDPTAVEVTPRIVEVYFDNVCNMSCIYCWDGFSSKIQQENKKFGRFEKNGVIIDNRVTLTPDKDQLTDKFWQWMHSNGSHLRRFQVLGGEPFFQPQLEQCLTFLENNRNPGLEFNIVSNLKIDSKRLDAILMRIKRIVDAKKILRFEITASIDSLGEEQEYVRYGIDIEQWKENFKIVAKHDWIRLNINQTLTSLVMKKVPDLLDFVNDIRQTREIDHFFGTPVMTPSAGFLHPGIFGPKFFQKEIDEILTSMPTDTVQQQRSKEYMISQLKQINGMCRNPQKISQLGTFLDEIDRRRNLDWKKTFPWLVKEIDNVV